MRTIFREKLTDFANFYNEIMPIARDMISEKKYRIHKELDAPTCDGDGPGKGWFDKRWEIARIDENELSLYYSDPIYGDDEACIPFWAFEDKEGWYLQCIAAERARRKRVDDINRETRK